jgi:hypothetical protein
MRFIDPDGMNPNDIIINGTNKFKAEAFNDLQKLTNTSLTLLNDGTVIKSKDLTKDQIKDVAYCGVPSSKKHTLGTSVVDGLISNSKVVKIEETKGPLWTDPGNQNDAQMKDYSYGLGSGSTVHYDPQNVGLKTYTTNGVVNEDGTIGAPAFTGLAHELIHAWINIQGAVDSRISPATDPDTARSFSISNNEVLVRLMENSVRKENNIKNRAVPRTQPN